MTIKEKVLVVVMDRENWEEIPNIELAKQCVNLTLKEVQSKLEEFVNKIKLGLIMDLDDETISIVVRILKKLKEEMKWRNLEYQ